MVSDFQLTSVLQDDVQAFTDVEHQALEKLLKLSKFGIPPHRSFISELAYYWNILGKPSVDSLCAQFQKMKIVSAHLTPNQRFVSDLLLVTIFSSMEQWRCYKVAMMSQETKSSFVSAPDVKRRIASIITDREGMALLAQQIDELFEEKVPERHGGTGPSISDYGQHWVSSVKEELAIASKSVLQAKMGLFNSANLKQYRMTFDPVAITHAQVSIQQLRVEASREVKSGSTSTLGLFECHSI
jgi:hypothetical protein